MLKVRFHGRGGQGAKIASRVLGTAAFLEGYYAQDFPLYGAERRGAPIAAFTRISKEPILERGVISEPDVIVVMDETLLDDPLANPLSGLGKEGLVFINTTHKAEDIKKRYRIDANVLTLDITKISLDILGKPILSALAGGAASKIVRLKETSLKEAVTRELSDITHEKGLIEKNIEASIYCFNALPSVLIKSNASHKKSDVITMPFEAADISSPSVTIPANTPLKKTGNWRIFKPVWDYELCTKCMTCVMRCPDGCIRVNEEGFPYSDYENCKGCMICAEECPAKAIRKEREVHAW
ncbi:MAG: 2-oxoacid:acceptor oxidoreductase family protein [Nitrospirae bacterium]|nr:2-oxoacid:acceptor oxidoreductase family protein [Nitrospirota bacterium]